MNDTFFSIHKYFIFAKFDIKEVEIRGNNAIFFLILIFSTNN